MEKWTLAKKVYVIILKQNKHYLNVMLSDIEEVTHCMLVFTVLSFIVHLKYCERDQQQITVCFSENTQHAEPVHACSLCALLHH